ncbi:MAG: 1-acyl-sn-glycerol-3-phosphate acyltransferase [Polyangiaceae bacterium]|nr:1-acyl-sn-glycerol-3-phosphate acyltransferase [Polyangiaceae bacterium]
MPSLNRSLFLSLRNAYELLAISAATVIDAARGRDARNACDARIESFAARVVANNKMTVQVHGRENIPREGSAKACVIMSNHASHYDVPILYYVLGGHMRMVAKKELFAMPILGRAMREAGMIEVDRQDHRRAIEGLAQAKTELARGTSIWIAPEGTRSPTGELLPFKKGGFALAVDLGVSILPITIKGTRNALPAKSLLSTAGVAVDVFIHPMVETATFAGLDAQGARSALLSEVRKSIASAM